MIVVRTTRRLRVSSRAVYVNQLRGVDESHKLDVACLYLPSGRSSLMSWVGTDVPQVRACLLPREDAGNALRANGGIASISNQHP